MSVQTDTTAAPRVVLSFSLVVLAGVACTDRPVDDGPLSALIDTERRFAAASATLGMKAAFLQFLDDDSILFRPHPVNGKEYTAARPDAPIRLTWEPTRADTSRAGDLGYTTGPYKLEFIDEA